MRGCGTDNSRTTRTSWACTAWSLEPEFADTNFAMASNSKYSFIICGQFPGRQRSEGIASRAMDRFPRTRGFRRRKIVKVNEHFQRGKASVICDTL